MRQLPDDRLDRALDEAARTAARLINSTANPAYTISRYLLLLGDSLQDRKPLCPIEHPRSPPGRYA